MAAPAAIIEHELPGRLRLRVPAGRGNVVLLRTIVEALSRQPDVQKLDANPLTGGIVLHHSGSAQAITAHAAEQGIFELEAAPPKNGKLSPKAASSSGRPILSGPLDKAAAGLTGLALLQAARGQIIGSAVENFWNAYGAHRILRRPQIASGFALLGIVQLLRGRLLGSASSLLFYSLVARQLGSMDRATTPQAAASKPSKVASE